MYIYYIYTLNFCKETLPALRNDALVFSSEKLKVKCGAPCTDEYGSLPAGKNTSATRPHVSCWKEDILRNLV